MAGQSDGLTFDTGFDARPGEVVDVAPGIVRVTAPNDGPYTFTGTNSYLLGDERLVLIDPGPDDENHLDALGAAIADRPVEAILITHTHRDHSGLARRARSVFDAPLWFGGPHRLSRAKRPLEINPLTDACDWDLEPDRTLIEGEVLELIEMPLVVVETPGHCANHLGFGLPGTDYLFSGDHVMGWNSTLVAPPDGSMGEYFSSLVRLIEGDWKHYLPGHGGPIPDGREFARGLRAHRQMRNRQIVTAIEEGARNVSQVVEKLYPGVPASTKRAAAMTVAAHVEYLENEGAIRVWRVANWTRLAPI